MEDADVVIPYVRIDQVMEFMKKFPSKEMLIGELLDQFGKSNVYNALPTLQLLGLCEHDKKGQFVRLTDLGEKFKSALVTGDEKRAADFIKNHVDQSQALSFVKALLERKASLSILDIGRELAFRYGKKWNNPLTYKTYGAASASILSFVGYGNYTKGILRKGTARAQEERISPPYAGFKKIVTIVETIKTMGEADLHTLSEKLKTKESRLGSEIKNCIDLGFVERPVPGRFTVTEFGKNFVDPLNKDEIFNLFREALLKSPFSRVIRLLSNKVFDDEGLGEILKHHTGGKWLKSKTILSHGKKFLGWLNSAKLLEKVERGKYRLKSEMVKTAEKPKLERVPSLTDYFNLGKMMGILSSSIDFEKNKHAVEKIIEFCKQEKTFSTIVDLLEEHYKLFLDLKDARIFSADIKLIEKTLGFENLEGHDHE